MIGGYDFCGNYEWTFDWPEREGGHTLVRAYWDEAIHRDFQIHARELILRDGFAGMLKYWGHPLTEESPDLGFTITPAPEVFRLDIPPCPSKGFLMRNGLNQYRDYCDHGVGWIGPLLREAGFVVDHERNHCGQCWWELRKADSRRRRRLPARSHARTRPCFPTGRVRQRTATATAAPPTPDDKTALPGERFRHDTRVLDEYPRLRAGPTLSENRGLCKSEQSALRWWR